MAQGKKSFVLYCDLIDAIDHLTTLEKGKLFEHLLDYVNDKNPVLDDRVLLGSWKHIEQILKRDLAKYEKRAERSRENGSLGGRPKKPKKPSGLNNNPEEPKKPDTDTVTVNVTDTDINNYFIQESFVEWFNECRKFIKLKSNIKRLSRTEQGLFSQLKDTYTKEEFKKAFKGMSQDKYYTDNNLLFPIHFLKMENFNKFLNAPEDKELTLQEKIRGVVK